MAINAETGPLRIDRLNKANLGYELLVSGHIDSVKARGRRSILKIEEFENA